MIISLNDGRKINVCKDRSWAIGRKYIYCTILMRSYHCFNSQQKWVDVYRNVKIEISTINKVQFNAVMRMIAGQFKTRASNIVSYYYHNIKTVFRIFDRKKQNALRLCGKIELPEWEK